MPRVKLSEFRAKQIVNNHLNIPYNGFPFDADRDAISKIDETVRTDRHYVAKVDQGVKKRLKQGLVKLDLKDANEVIDALKELRKKKFTHFIIEEFVPHEKKDERYLAIERTREGIEVHYAPLGGIDIEESSSEVKRALIKDADDIKKVAGVLDIDPSYLELLIEAFDINYFSFLEVNPLVVSFNKLYFLDIAAEVDSAAEFFVDTWKTWDIRSAKFGLTPEEKFIKILSDKSSSSLTLNVLNPDGAIFMLLSGGGVSLALADEVKNLGYGEQLANYGEYSGNPTEEETFLYTKNLLSLLLKSKAQKKVLVIGGGVANFTDVRVTFKGVIHALSEVTSELQEQNVKVFVRRGGPHQKEGLAQMEKFLSENNLLGVVAGPEMVVSQIVAEAIKSIS